MRITETNVTDGQWKAELMETPEGMQVKRIVGAHFTIDGRHTQVLNPDGTTKFEWNQPAPENSSSQITLPLPDGPQTMMVSGFVGALMDTEGKVLLTVAQETLAKTPKRALIRTPFQTSATKLQGLIDGKDELDPKLADLLKRIGGGKPIDQMFSLGDIDVFPLQEADANRIGASNIGFGIVIKDPDLQQSLAANGQNRWCSEGEISALKRAGLLNSHSASAIDATKAK